MSNMDLTLTQIQDQSKAQSCLFCKSSELDEVNLGPMYFYDDVVTHYFCMLFSAGLVQKGSSDKEGILGFLPVDIWKEVRRGNRLKCTFCNQNGASIGCCKKSCKTMCHFRCGLDNGVQYQFLKNFTTYCVNHHVPQQIDFPENEWKCPICICVVEKDENPIMPTCCKGAVFHKECIKRMALNAGYFFKCPMCNATKGFIKEMRLYGVFVPEQDASWEREPLAFQDHYYQYSNCDAENCECPKGKSFDAEEGEFEIARCNVCGAAGVHVKCGKLHDADNWNCDACFIVLKNAGLTKPYNSCTISQSSSLTERVLNNPEIVDMSKIKFVKPANRYFPYPQGELRNFQNKGVKMLPDYRGLVLQVNVVNWLGSCAQKVGHVNDSFGFNANLLHKAAVPSPVRNRRSPPNTSLSTRGDFHPISEESSTRRKHAAKKRRTQSKSPRGRWQRGVVGKRKDKKKGSVKRPGPPVTTVHETMPANSTMPTNPILDTTNEVQEVEHQEHDKLNSVGNELPPAIGSSSPSSVLPAKRHKVFELGHSVVRDIFVHSNVFIEDAVDVDTEIDMTGLSPIQDTLEEQNEARFNGNAGNLEQQDHNGNEDVAMETISEKENEINREVFRPTDNCLPVDNFKRFAFAHSYRANELNHSQPNLRASCVNILTQKS